MRPSTITRADVLARFGAGAGDVCWQEVAPKLLDRARADELNDRLARAWPAIRARLAAVALGGDRLRAILAAAGAPIEPATLGWPPALFADALRHAREIRNRYTVLDVAADS
jgi:glycerol-1-phosphate dehydrogenase [NAD(P)+]